MQDSFVGLPNPLASDDEKRTTSYGLRVSRAIYGPFDGSNDYIVRRNANFIENRLFAEGKQPSQAYLDLLGYENGEGYANIDYSPIPIAKKFKKIVVNGYMNTDEKVNVTAMNKFIQERRDRRVLEAEFRMVEKDFIQGVQQEANMQLEDPDAFVPDDKDDLDIWKDMHEKEREELLMQEAVKFTFTRNDFDTIGKEFILSSGFDTSMGGVFQYYDAKGEIKYQYLMPEDMVYSPSKRNDLKDIRYAGHIEMMSISEARMRYGTEEEFLYKIAYKNLGVYDNPSIGYLGSWNSNWLNASDRPYDSFVVPVFHSWYKVLKTINYVTGTNRNGKKIFDIVKSKPDLKNPNKSAGAKQVWTAFQGAWYVGTEVMAEWGEQKNQIRPQTDLEDVLCPYTFYIWDNNGMSMLPTSKIDNIKASVKQMDLCRLKIQQIVAKAAPDGYDIEVDALYDVDLGKGVGTVSPMKLVQIRQQTGNMFYKRTDHSGNPNGGSPIKPNTTSFGSKLLELIELYNFELNNIRDYLGVNELREGSGVNPKLGLGIAQAQLAASNNATSDLYAGTLNIMNRVAEKTLAMIWDNLKYAKAWEGYKRILGEENVAFIKEAKELTDSNYDIKIQVKANPNEKEILANDITTALSAGAIQFEDSIAIKNIDDVKLAYRYMSAMQKKRRKQAMEDAQANSAQNAEIQAQTVQAKADADAQLEQAKADSQVMVVAAKGEAEESIAKRKFLYDMQLEGFKMGKELPPRVQIEFDELFDADDAKEMAELEMMEDQAMAAQQEQEQIEQ